MYIPLKYELYSTLNTEEEMLSELTARTLLEAEEKYDEVCDKYGDESANASIALRKMETARKAALNELLHALAEQRIYGAVQQGHEADAKPRRVTPYYNTESGF